MTRTPAPRWVRRGLTLVHDGPFPEPTEDELAAYRYTATPLRDRPLPTCGTVGSGRRAHLARDEDPCEDCVAANHEYQAAYRARRQDVAS